MDALGQASSALTAKSQLAVIDWVVAYQGTLRGLGVQEVGGAFGSGGFQGVGIGRRGRVQLAGPSTPKHCRSWCGCR